MAAQAECPSKAALGGQVPAIPVAWISILPRADTYFPSELQREKQVALRSLELPWLDGLLGVILSFALPLLPFP